MFEIWFRRHRIPATVNAVAAERFSDLVDVVDADRILDCLTDARSILRIDGGAIVAELLDHSLCATWKATRELFGSDPES